MSTKRSSQRLAPSTDPGAERVRLWERALSRRQLIGAAAGAAGILAAGGIWTPALADGGADPRPIPGGINGPGVFLHIYLPGAGAEPSLITDFNGFVGQALVKGQGTTGDGTRLYFDIDSRFMVGEYVGMDGQNHHGSFAMI